MVPGGIWAPQRPDFGQTIKSVLNPRRDSQLRLFFVELSLSEASKEGPHGWDDIRRPGTIF
jgi:hypothetical protein